MISRSVMYVVQTKVRVRVFVFKEEKHSMATCPLSSEKRSSDDFQLSLFGADCTYIPGNVVVPSP